MPSTVLPSLMVTVPVGGELGEVLSGPGQTVSVKVTAWPNADDVALEVSVVTTGALLTCWVRRP